MPMMAGAVSMAELDQAALWRSELWFVEHSTKLNWSNPEDSTQLANLRHVHLADLESAGPAVRLPDGRSDSSSALLAVGNRLWLVGADEVSYYENGALTRLSGIRRPARASRPFVYQGRAAVVTLGRSPTLATLDVDNGNASWTAREFPLGLPSEGGSLRTLRAVEAAGRLIVFVEPLHRRAGALLAQLSRARAREVASTRRGRLLVRELGCDRVGIEPCSGHLGARGWRQEVDRRRHRHRERR